MIQFVETRGGELGLMIMMQMKVCILCYQTLNRMQIQKNALKTQKPRTHTGQGDQRRTIKVIKILRAQVQLLLVAKELQRFLTADFCRSDIEITDFSDQSIRNTLNETKRKRKKFKTDAS